MRGFQLSSAGEARLHANGADQRKHREDAQQQSLPKFGHGTLTSRVCDFTSGHGLE
jgi:hypothetical protein